MAQFRTTTPRVCGVELDMNKLKLNFWLNGRPQDTRNRQITSGTWFPTIKFKDPNYTVILNPFASPTNVQENTADALQKAEISLYRTKQEPLIQVSLNKLAKQIRDAEEPPKVEKPEEDKAEE